MPIDNSSRYCIKERKTETGIDDEKECHNHYSPGVRELQRVGHDYAQAALRAKQFPGNDKAPGKAETEQG
jgi:hypothetical protein